MTKDDVINAVAKGAKLKKAEARDIIDMTFEALARAIKRDKRFSVPGFGTFTVRSRKASKGRNPRTGAVIDIEGSRVVRFKAASTLKKDL